jgi:hypothetical protein
MVRRLDDDLVLADAAHASEQRRGRFIDEGPGFESGIEVRDAANAPARTIFRAAVPEGVHLGGRPGFMALAERAGL